MFEFLQNILEKKTEENSFRKQTRNLIDESDWKPRFILFTVSSSLMATLGLLMDNVSILIGAMVIAPLLTPVIGLSVGVGAGSLRMIWHSLRSLALGSVLAVGTSALLSMALADEIPSQLYSNFNHTELYALVALISGIVGVYSWYKPSVSNVGAGVAIAVALIPPMAFTGMVLGIGNEKGLIDVLTLIFVNMGGIFLGGLITFAAIAIAAQNESNLLSDHVDKEAKKKSS